jgi:hypothetical protein
MVTRKGTSHNLIVAHTGPSNGFLEGNVLVFKAGNSSGDYHRKTNADNFEKWLNETN